MTSVVYAVYSIRTGIVESVFYADERASARAKFLNSINDDKGHGVCPVAYEPINDVHRHYRLSQQNATTVMPQECSNPLCTRKPKYWSEKEYGYWSVESCDEALTRKMAEHLVNGPSPDNC